MASDAAEIARSVPEPRRAGIQRERATPETGEPAARRRAPAMPPKVGRERTCDWQMATPPRERIAGLTMPDGSSMTAAPLRPGDTSTWPVASSASSGSISGEQVKSSSREDETSGGRFHRRA